MAMLVCPHCGEYTYPQQHVINKISEVVVVHNCQFCGSEVKTEHFKNRTCPKCGSKTLKFQERVLTIGFDWDDCIWECSNCG